MGAQKLKASTSCEHYCISPSRGLFSLWNQASCHPSACAHIPATVDTGCQSCLGGLKVVYRLGLSESDLIPVTMRMRTANNDGIKILGAMLLRY